MQPKSHTLFHFTKNIDFLKDILVSGFWPRYCLEDATWYSLIKKQTFIAYPIVCFCDIPLSRVDEHVNFYGNYGIGVTKNWAITSGLSPVLYIRENSQQHEALKQMFANNIKSRFYDGSEIHINSLLAVIKPVEGFMRIGENLINKEFYQENEWRYSAVEDTKTTSVRSWLYENEYLNEELLIQENSRTKNLKSLKILPPDIKYLFVKQDSDIPHLANFIQTELDMYSSQEIKILLSRIISLETIKYDL